MKEVVTTYTVKGKNFPNIWLFKYDLNGFLKEWTLEEGELTQKQINWLFQPQRFPYLEADLLSHIAPLKNLEVTKGELDLSFDVFYSLFNKKVGKLEAERAWKRLNKADQLNAIKGIKAYDGYLKRSRKEKVYPATYLNNRRFDDQFNTLG